MKWLAVGFVLGWAAAFVPCLIGSKFQGPIVKRIIKKYGPVACSTCRAAWDSIATRVIQQGISLDKRARIAAEEKLHD